MAVDSASPAQPSVRAAARVIDLLDALRQAPDGLGLGDLARAAGVPKSTALRYLTTLEERLYVDRDRHSGVYRLGLVVQSQAQVVAPVQQAVRRSLDRLRDRFDETGTFGILDGTRTLVLDVVESRQTIRLGAEVGARGHLHSSAMGKAIAATLPDRVVRHFVEAGGLKPFTPKTITDPNSFYAEVERIRGRGYATTDEEKDLGTYGVAVALPTERLRAAIGLSAPAIRFDPEAVPLMAESLRTEAESIATTLRSLSH